MLLALLVFVLGVGAVVGGYALAISMPARLARRKLDQRLADLSTPVDVGVESESVVKRLIEGPLPSAGTKLQLDGKDIGEITSVASLPTASGERVVALGYIRREAAIPGKVLQAGEGRAMVAELPFQNIFG